MPEVIPAPRPKALTSAQTGEDKLQLLLKQKGYKIEKKISSGKYSNVYRGIIISSQKPIALKIVDMCNFNDTFKNKYLPRELAALICVRHTYTLLTHDIIKYFNKILIFMEWANGGDLADYIIANGACSEALSQQWFTQISSALLYLHDELHLAHRDIKLDNVLLHNNDCKLADFGFAKVCMDNSNNVILSETYCGTLPYLSPQIVSKTPYDAFKSDMWALGVSLYCLLNNRFPFMFGDPITMVEQQQNSSKYLPTRFVKRFSFDTCDMMLKLLEPDEEKRLSMSDVITHNWIKKKAK